MNIIGLSLQLPKSNNHKEFWENLINHVDMVTENDERFPKGINDIPSRMGILDDIESFDNMLFKINSKQAIKMDPQVRLSLENTLGCILDAGLDPDYLKGKNVGVYSGACFSDSMTSQLNDPNLMDGREMVGNALSMVANRVSFYFDFKGPSCNFDTACSSSLVALDKAFTDINNNIVEWAVVIGTSIILNPGGNVGFSRYKMLSPTGRCASFDQSADGYARSEGCVAILISKDSIFNGNSYASILGTGVNSDGFTTRGITFPSHEQQTNLYRDIFKRYNLNQNEIEYIEAHGTGTVIGDKQELIGLSSFFNKKIQLGSVKSNMGHCEGCSGLAGLAKVILSIKHGVIPGNLHLTNPNKYILENQDKFDLIKENRNWSGGMVGISSFGFGGTNAHAIIYGKTKLLKENDLFRLSFKKNIYRGSIKYNECSKVDYNLYKDPKYCFLYTGMGSNYLGMANDIFDDEIGKEVIKRCHNHLKSIDSNIDLINCYHNIISQDSNKIYSMLMLTSLQLAITEILVKRYGIKKSFIIGHSAGEVASAYADDLLTIEECIGISYARGKAVDSISNFNGLMVAIGCSIEESNYHLNKVFGKDYSTRIVVGCDNSPKACTISGYEDEVNKFIEYCEKEEIFNKIVRTDGVAFHSPQIQSINDLSTKIIKSHIPTRDMIRSEKWISTIPENEDVNKYNVKYVMGGFTKTVYFREAVSKLPKDTIVIEIGPAGLLKRSILESNDKIGYVASQKYNNSLSYGLKLFEKNLWIDFGIAFKKTCRKGAVGVYKDLILGRPKNKFPTLDPSLWVPKHVPSEAQNNDIKYKFFLEKCQGHKIDNRILVPATGSIVAIIETFTNLSKNKDKIIEIKNFNIKRALIFDNDDIEVKIKLNSLGDFYITTLEDEIVSSGNIQFVDSKLPNFNNEYEKEDITFFKNDFYSLLRSKGYQYKDNFQSVEWMTNDKGLIKFNDWYSYLDCYLQSLLPNLALNNWELMLPTEISSILINYNKKIDTSIINISKKTYSNLGNYVIGENVAIYGLKTMSAPRNKMNGNELLYNLKYVKYGENVIETNNAYEYSEICRDYLSQRLELYKNDKDHLKRFMSNNIRPNLQESIEKLLKNPKSILLKIIDEIDIDKYYQNPLKVINEHKDHEKLYKEDLLMSIDNNILYTCIQLITENLKEYNFFEIGSGTGGMTDIICKILNTFIDINWKYTASDYFKGYLPGLKEINPNIDTVIYDVNSKLEPNKYNCILAMNALHICDNIKETVNNLYNSLAPGGFVLVQEGCNDCITLFWGMADSTWNFNDEREKGLWISNEHWISIFKDTGFKVILNYMTSNKTQTLFLLMKEDSHIISNLEMNTNNVDEIKLFLNNSKDNIVSISTNNEIDGIDGFIKTINKEPETPKLIMSSNNSQLCINYNNGFYARNLVNKDHFKLKNTSEYGVSLEFENIGDLQSKRWVNKREPNNDENVKVNVKFASLNFKDVMLSYGKLSKDAVKGWTKNGFIGFEMVGTTDNGRRVMGFGLNAISDIVHTNNSMLWDIPDNWSFAEAARVPTVYATAYYSLVTRGNINKNDKVLIHAGTGGVGLAALSIAFSYDCEVFTTCSTKEKKEFLLKRFPKLKSENIGNSRNITFEGLVMEKTNGNGVDIVLNSLSGDLLKASLRCVAKHGKFVEIGRYDFINNTKLGLEPFLSNISFHAIDLDQVFEFSKIWNEIYKGVEEMLNSNIINPLPTTEYEANKIDDAMRYLASGSHIGKVVINFSNFSPEYISHKFFASPNKTYLVHGGLGGFGLTFIKWICDRGARNIIITSRSGIKNGEQRYLINNLEKDGVKIKIYKGDIGKENEFNKFISELNEMPALDGIFLLSMVLNDSLFKNMTQNQWDVTVGSKINAIKRLDKWSRSNKVSYFMTWSSITAGFGNPGQSNYAYGNSFCDNLILDRNKNNLSGLSIQWGPVDDVGFVSRQGKINSLSNILPQSIVSCLGTIDKLLGCERNGIYCNYINLTKKIDTVNDKSLVDLTCRILGIEYTESINNISLMKLGVDSLLSTNLQNTFKKKGIKLTLDQINNITLEKIKELE